MPIRKFQGIAPKLGNDVYIDDMAVVIGDVEIGDDSSLWPMTVARGDVQRIRIGARTNIQDGSVLHVTSDNEFTPGGFALTIGDDVTVGHGAILHACTIHARSLIGMHAVVLDAAVVESEVLVGAGAVVSPGKRLKSGYLYLGAPAKQVRELTAREREYFLFSSAHYVSLKNKHLADR
ncbi:MAG: gamma carbonic anhydrase family protein [Pseudomonadota bacterium]